MASQTRDGFQFRFAVTEGSATDQDVGYISGSEAGDPVNGVWGQTTPYSPTVENVGNLDERIWSTGIAYQKNLASGNQIWLSFAYEQHEDVSALALTEEAVCSESDNDAYRVAGRYSHDWGNGQNSWLAVMYEELDYDADDCVTPGSANAGIGFNGGIIYAVGGADANPTWSGVEREAWMISGKHTFGNGFDFRFSYMDADEWDCDTGVCTDAQEDDTDASAYNVGLFYTMPAGTELRLTYSEVQNEDNAQYDFGINGGGAVKGEDVDMVAVGIVHRFD